MERTMSPIRILLVDAHPVVRVGLRKMLENEGDMEIVGEAANGQEALAKGELLSPNVVIMDIGMPGMYGIETMRQLKGRFKATNIVVLTLYGRKCLAQAIEAGAAGYLQKAIGPEELVRAIRAVCQGQSPLDPSLSRELFNEFANLAKGNNQHSCLSERELEMVYLIASGATNKEIAAQLFVSETTVKRGIRNIFDKLSVRDRAEAVSEAYKRGLM